MRGPRTVSEVFKVSDCRAVPTYIHAFTGKSRPSMAITRNIFRIWSGFGPSLLMATIRMPEALLLSPVYIYGTLRESGITAARSHLRNRKGGTLVR
jgi:hypothetical protein